MGAVKDKVRDLKEMLDKNQKEAKSLVDTVHRLQDYLEEEPKTIIQASLERLLDRIMAQAAKRTKSVVVLVSPDWIVSVGESYDVNSDFWLKRLKSQGFFILSLRQFGMFIRSLQLQVTQGNYMLVIDVLKANAESQRASSYPAPSARKAEEPREASTSSEWNLPDWLPAPPPYPPLPRRLFKD